MHKEGAEEEKALDMNLWPELAVSCMQIHSCSYVCGSYSHKHWNIAAKLYYITAHQELKEGGFLFLSFILYIIIILKKKKKIKKINKEVWKTKIYWEKERNVGTVYIATQGREIHRQTHNE